MATGVCKLPCNRIASLSPLADTKQDNASIVSYLPFFRTRQARNLSSSRLVPSKSSVCLRKLQLSTSFSSKGTSFGSNGTTYGKTKSVVSCSADVEALVFDCDGVILESEDLHREAYNAAFQHFDVRTPDSKEAPVVWTPEFYDELQNTVGGGKPKMRWYFKRHGWPTSSILPDAPKDDEEQAKLVDTLQDWKSAKYRDFIGSGSVKPRPGILEVMDGARAKGLKVAVCSASTKESCIYTLTHLIGKDRFEALDLFLAGDDVSKKKPDPSIYLEATKRLNIAPEKCLVIEDSAIGLAAALGGGMHCVITTTASTESQEFKGATAVFGDMSDVNIDELVALVGKKAAVEA